MANGSSTYDSSNSRSYEVLPPSVKPTDDKNLYRFLRLQNGLKVCIMQMTEYSYSKPNATALMRVGAGLFHETTLFGLPHLLEHIIFLGNEKYPMEDDFNVFVKRNGGRFNAKTSDESTSYHISGDIGNFKELLEKFAHLFIKPLIRQETVAREIHSVDNEYKKNGCSSCWKVVLNLSTNYSLSSFGGNLKLLTENDSDCKNLWKQLQEFRKKFYTGNRMSLVIYSTFPIEEMERCVIEYFSDIPSKNDYAEEDFNLEAEEIFDMSRFHKMYYFSKNIIDYQVELNWIIPSQLKLYKCKPAEYIFTCLNQKKIVLIKYLEERSWIDETSCSFFNHNNIIFSRFGINIKLSKKGYKKFDKVIEAVFGYVIMMRNFILDIETYKKIQLQSEKNYNLKKNIYQDNELQDLTYIAEDMQNYSPREYLSASYLLYEYDPQQITSVLNCIVPESVNVMIGIPKNYKFNFEEIDQLYRLRYAEKDIPKKWIRKWNLAKPKSVFDISCLDVLDTDESDGSEIEGDIDIDVGEIVIDPLSLDFKSIIVPTKILDTSLVELWYQNDESIDIVCYYTRITIPQAAESIQSACLFDIFVELLKAATNKLKNYDLCEKITINNYENNDELFNGFTISTCGDLKQLSAYIIKFAKLLVKLTGEIEEKAFKLAKKKIIENYTIHYRNRDHCSDIFRAAIFKGLFGTFEKLSYLPDLKLDDMQRYCGSILNNIFISTLVTGAVNVSSQFAQKITKTVVNIFKSRPVDVDNLPMITCYQIPIGDHCIQTLSLCERSLSTTHNYYQIGFHTVKNAVIADVIEIFLNTSIFNTFRTQEQLAYEVTVEVHIILGVIGFCFIIVSPFSPEYIDNRLNEFLIDQYKKIQMISQEHFALLKNTLKTKYLASYEVVENDWLEILSKTYMFDRYLQQVDILKNLSLEDVLVLWRESLNFNSEKNYRKLSIRMLSHCNPLTRSL